MFKIELQRWQVLKSSYLCIFYSYFRDTLINYRKIKPRYDRISYQNSSKGFRQLFENPTPVDFDMGCGLLYTGWHSSELQWPARRSISGRYKCLHYSASVICEIMA